MPTKCMPQTEDLANASFLSQSGMCERILVVEEACDLRQLNAEVLIDAGHLVEVAEDVATAWASLQLHRYDLLVTDQFLPATSVVRLVKQIHAANMALPIILVSRSLPTWELTLHPWPQTVKVLCQPYTIEKLLSLVKNVLRPSATVRDQAAPPPAKKERQGALGFRA